MHSPIQCPCFVGLRTETNMQDRMVLGWALERGPGLYALLAHRWLRVLGCSSTTSAAPRVAQIPRAGVCAGCPLPPGRSPGKLLRPRCSEQPAAPRDDRTAGPPRGPSGVRRGPMPPRRPRPRQRQRLRARLEAAVIRAKECHALGAIWDHSSTEQTGIRSSKGGRPWMSDGSLDGQHGSVSW